MIECTRMTQSCTGGRFSCKYQKKKIFTVRVVKHWNKLPREVDNAPWLLVFKRHLSNYKSSFFLTVSLHAFYTLCSHNSFLLSLSLKIFYHCSSKIMHLEEITGSLAKCVPFIEILLNSPTLTHVPQHSYMSGINKLP